MWWVGAIPMTWWVQDFSGLWICTKEFFGGWIGVLFLPTIFLARKLRNGEEENKQVLREREKERRRDEREKKTNRCYSELSYLKVHCKSAILEGLLEEQKF
jgi:hypothetical protein